MLRRLLKTPLIMVSTMTKFLQGKLTLPSILCLSWCHSSWADAIVVKYPYSRSSKNILQDLLGVGLQCLYE